MKKLTLITTLLLLSGCTQLIRPNFTPEFAKLRSGQYQLDQDHSYLFFRVDHLGLSKMIGRFNSIEAVLDFKPENPQSMQLSGIIAANSIDLNNDDLESTLQETAWFDSARFPEITFNSNRVEVLSSGELQITGDFTMRGITKPLVITAEFNGGADNLITRRYTIGFSASAVLNRSEFGMDAFSAFAGDQIEIELHGEFLRN